MLRCFVAELAVLDSIVYLVSALSPHPIAIMARKQEQLTELRTHLATDHHDRRKLINKNAITSSITKLCADLLESVNQAHYALHLWHELKGPEAFSC